MHHALQTWPCDRHMSVVSSASIYWLRQLQRVRQSLDDESAAILVHAFASTLEAPLVYTNRLPTSDAKVADVIKLV